MLTALWKDKIISADMIGSTNYESRSADFTCPITGQKVHLVKEHPRMYQSGKITTVRRHFSRGKNLLAVPPYFCDDDDIFEQRDNSRYVNESCEHIEGKRFIKTLCDQWYSVQAKEFTVQEEYQLKLPTGKRRIIDVAVLLPCGIIEAHEVQLSPITIDELKDRTDDYESIGVNVYWYFGKKAATFDNMNWEFNRTGFSSPELHFTEVNL